MKEEFTPYPHGPWGRDSLMALAAVRYCLGRQTYIVSDCCDWLIASWKDLKPSMRDIIKRDIKEEFKRDDEYRADGIVENLPLGANMDREQWERVRKLWTDC